MPSEPLIGLTFGRLTVLERAGHYRKKLTYRCKCQCGNEKVVLGCGLRNGHTRSCGCLRHDATHKVTHGQTRGERRSATYQTWVGLRPRCYNPKERSYPNYGGRGITVCERWATFKNFLADMGERPPGKTIDRIDGSKGYSKDNCRWANKVQQIRGRRNTRLVEFGGVTKPLAEWAEEMGLKYDTLFMRLRRMPLDRAMTM